jgi:hypothetical protein
MKKPHMTKGGGRAPPATTRKAEAKTGRPSKAAVMAKPDATAKKMMEKTGKRGGKW